MWRHRSDAGDIFRAWSSPPHRRPVAVGSSRCDQAVLERGGRPAVAGIASPPPLVGGGWGEGLSRYEASVRPWHQPLPPPPPTRGGGEVYIRADMRTKGLPATSAASTVHCMTTQV